MLRHIALRDFVIVESLDLDFAQGFSVLTGETGAGKSILIDALQLALGSRGEAGVVREGAQRAEIVAEFDMPPACADWLVGAGFEPADALLLKRIIDAQGRSRAWINGGAATLAQLRELGESLVDIHGQHAWQSLMRPDAVRGLLDAYAGVDAAPVALAWTAWRGAQRTLDDARQRQGDLERECERLQWQLAEMDKLGPGADEWVQLNQDHARLAHAQAILDATTIALQAVSEADTSAEGLTAQAIDALQDVLAHDVNLTSVVEALQGAQAQLQDAAHSLHAALRHTDLEPERLQALDERLSVWVSLARRWRRPPDELPALSTTWRAELAALDAATDLAALEREVDRTRASYNQVAKALSKARSAAAPRLSEAITHAMQQLGMGGGRFEVSVQAVSEPQAYGMEMAEFLVAGHAGSTPRPLSKVASGGELSRISLAIAVTTSQLGQVGTLIFDEIDAGVGGAVAETVGQLMKQLGRDRQVLAVTHLPQVAACADQHFVVSKAARQGVTTSEVEPVLGEARVMEIARMLGGQQLSGAGLAHAKEMLQAQAAAAKPARSRKKSGL